VIAAGASIYQRPLSPGEEIEKENLDKFAVALGFKSVEYLADVPPIRGAARGAQAQQTPPPAEPQSDQKPPAATKPPGGGAQ
jgi:hypothetical protein